MTLAQLSEALRAWHEQVRDHFGNWSSPDAPDAVDLYLRGIWAISPDCPYHDPALAGEAVRDGTIDAAELLANVTLDAELRLRVIAMLHFAP